MRPLGRYRCIFVSFSSKERLLGECVGLGSNFDGIPSTPIDLTDVSCYPVLVNGLSDRGFKENEIRKIMGLNLFNYLKKFDK